jgi:MerR family transcriptional regulator, copper efflux regulator
VNEPRPFRIGELSAQSGVSRDALRYYERLGLMPRARRTAGGFRLYPPGTSDRIRFIKQAQLHGLTLREIRELLGFQNRWGRERCRHVRNLLTRKLGDVDARLQQLQDFRRTLQDYLSQCERALGGVTDEECPVVRDFSDEPSEKRR